MSRKNYRVLISQTKEYKKWSDASNKLIVKTRQRVKNKLKAP